jgi:hypothetical protein
VLTDPGDILAINGTILVVVFKDDAVEIDRVSGL